MYPKASKVSPSLPSIAIGVAQGFLYGVFGYCVDVLSPPIESFCLFEYSLCSCFGSRCIGGSWHGFLSYLTSSFFILGVSLGWMSRAVLSFFFCFLVFLRRLWRMPVCFACNRPVPVTLSLFLAPELLLVFGIVGIFWFSFGGGNYSKHLSSFQFYGMEKLPALLL